MTNLNRQDFVFLEDNKYNKKTDKFSLKGYRTYAKCVYVYDGDTVHIVFRIPNSDECYKWIIRLIGIDTPEIKSKNANEKKKANEACEYLRNLILNKLIIVECLEFDKYGRLLGNLFLEGDSVSLSQKMISAGFAKPYDGGHKEGWDELDEE
jgi:endonuclease YncB( thermonuclease family)